MIRYRGRVITLSLLIIVLAVMYVMGALFAGQASGGADSRQSLLSSFRAAQAAEVQLLIGGKSRVVLKKQGSAWVVMVGSKTLPASSVRVEAFLSSVSDLREGKLVGSKAAYFSDFGLQPNDAGRVTVTSSDGKVLADILVGKPGASGFEDYLRLADTPRVFLTKSSLNFYLSQERSYWYRLFVFPDQVEANNIVALTVTGDLPLEADGRAWSRGSFRLVRKEGTASNRWSLVGKPEPLSNSKVNAILNNIASLHGIDFLIDPGNTRTANRSFEIDVSTTGGEDWLMKGREVEGGERILATVTGSSDVYILNTEAVRRALQPFRDLRLSN